MQQLMTDQRPTERRSGWGTSKYRGFTLLEVLIALLVLSVGLLGLAGLQASGLQNNHRSYQLSQATILAQSMLEQLRANRSDSKAGQYDIDLTESPAADQDRVEIWRDQLAAVLPQATGAIAVDSNDIATVTVQWSGGRDTDGTSEIQVQTQL